MSRLIRRTITQITLGFVLCLTSGCIYSKVKSPLDIDLDNTELGHKVGRASNYSIMWLVAWGDAGTEAAAKDANMTVIRHMDAEFLIILFGLYTRQTTIVYGD